jgi:tetratricopeptide (TPR) repeat protein
VTTARFRGLRPALFVVFCALVAPHSLSAQRRGGSNTSSKALSTNTDAVRAELAAVLLQSKKYADAAREYRALLARDPNNFEYRLNLARALAWGGHPQDAERELRVLQSKRMQVATIDSLLRAVRESMEPRAGEAMSWVSERPSYNPYRLALARALARERYDRLSGAQYDTLILGTGVGDIPPPLVLRHEQIDMFLKAGNVTAGAASMRALLRAVPADTETRHQLAVLLTDGRWKTEGRAQYDTLLATAPTAGLFTERGQLRLEVADTSGAESDMNAAIARGGTTTAYLTLGNLYRERGDNAPARGMYRLALGGLNDAPDVRRSVKFTLAEMAREDRPVAAFAPHVSDDPGWGISSEGVGDNLGVYYAGSTLSGTVPLGSSIRIGAAALHQYLGEHSDERSINLTAVGGEGSLSAKVGYGSFLLGADVSGGGLHLPGGRSIPIGSVALATWVSAWEMAFEESEGPAYPTLLTTTSVQPLTGNADAITEQSSTGMLGGPLGPADIAASAQQTRLSDGNRRTTVQGFVRLPLTPGVNVVYSGTRITFAERSTRYWDPISYDAHAVGLELGSQSYHGLSATVRALPGLAWSRDVPDSVNLAGVLRNRAPRSPAFVNKRVFQLTTGGELTWRDPQWEGTAAVTYGQGRTGDYRRLGVTLGMRVFK